MHLKPPITTFWTTLDQVATKYRQEIASKFRSLGGTYAKMDLWIMSEALFAIENEVEHQSIQTATIHQAKRRAAKQMNKARNILLDILGENEYMNHA